MINDTALFTSGNTWPVIRPSMAYNFTDPVLDRSRLRTIMLQGTRDKLRNQNKYLNFIFFAPADWGVSDRGAYSIYLGLALIVISIQLSNLPYGILTDVFFSKYATASSVLLP